MAKLYEEWGNPALAPQFLLHTFGVALVLCVGMLLWKKERHWALNLLLLLIAFMPFNTQNVIHDMFFWMFPVMALVERGIPLLVKKKED